MESSVRFLNIDSIFNFIYTGIAKFFSAITSIDIRFSASWLLTILTLLFIVFMVIMIYTRIRIFEVEDEFMDKYKNQFVKPQTSSRPVSGRWERITQLFASGNPNDWRVAILEADSMLDELIMSLGYPGENLGERLRSIQPGDFPALQDAWEAHKIRNKIAHEGMNYALSSRDAESARRHFEYVFRDAGVI
jgi:hypothetical protein